MHIGVGYRDGNPGGGFVSRPWQILTSAICIAGGIFIYTKSAGDFSPALGLVCANVSRADVMHLTLRLSIPF